VAEQANPNELITLQELVVSNASEFTALVAMLERKGVLTQAEVLEEITRLHEQGPKAP
jgi:mannitol/fructose-specific phosphotransferase system IIA component (Ntr-type)